MSGFKNCSSIAEFKVEMRFEDISGKWHKVAYVLPNGAAVCPPVEEDMPNKAAIHSYSVSTSFSQSQIPICTLDLDSIWLGRRYILTSDDEQPMGTVVLADDDLVVIEDRYGRYHVWARGRFREHWKPFPLPAPAGEQPKPAAEWKPEVGNKCLCLNMAGVGEEIFVRAVHGDWAWVATDEAPGNPGVTVHIKDNLRPIPDELSVKSCPHCGGKAGIIGTDATGYIVECKSHCLGNCTFPDDAIHRWNNRMEVPSC